MAAAGVVRIGGTFLTVSGKQPSTTPVEAEASTSPPHLRRGAAAFGFAYVIP